MTRSESAKLCPCRWLIVLSIAWLSAPGTAQTTFTDTACLKLGGLESCEDHDDPSICAAIRDLFCEDLEECDLEVTKMPNLGGASDDFIVRGDCPHQWPFKCNGLVRKPPGGIPLVIEPPKSDPEWIPMHFRLEGAMLLKGHQILKEFGDLDGFQIPDALQDQVDSLFTSSYSEELGPIAHADGIAEPLDIVPEWPWSTLVPAAGDELPQFTVESPVRIALIDSGISRGAFEQIEDLDVGISEGLATHPLVNHLSVVVPQAHLDTLHPHGTNMAGTIARTLHRFVPDPSAIELIIYRGFDKKCAPAVGVVDAIEDAADKGIEIIVIAAEMANGHPTLKAAIDGAVGAGSLVLVGAPNENREITAEEPAFPASWNHQGLVVVSSVNQSEEAVDAFSQDFVDFHAPGRGVPTLSLAGNDEWHKGTSLATAIVSAVAAMTLSQLPADFVPRELEPLLVDGVRKLEALDGKSSSGGVIDLMQCIELARAIGQGGDGPN